MKRSHLVVAFIVAVILALAIANGVYGDDRPKPGDRDHQPMAGTISLRPTSADPKPRVQPSEPQTAVLKPAPTVQLGEFTTIVISREHARELIAALTAATATGDSSLVAVRVRTSTLTESGFVLERAR